MAAPESVQFFQFDSKGNMYVYPAGSGCTGVPKLVHPGDKMIFSGYEEHSQVACSDSLNWCQFESSPNTSYLSEATAPSARSFHEPLKEEVLDDLCHKNFSPETLKKVKWAVKIYCE